MDDFFSIKQGNTISLFEEEIDFIESLLINRGVNSDALDIDQKILNLNSSYVGYIKTSKRKIEIIPKNDSVTLNHIMRLYYFVYGNFRNFQDEIFDINPSQNYLNIAQMFIKELKRLRYKGLPNEYRTIIEMSKFIKGKVDFPKSYLNIVQNKDYSFYCETDNLSQNTYINTVIKAAFKKVINKDYGLKKNSVSLELMFKNVYYDLHQSEKIKEVVFDSKNYYCKDVFFLSRLILEEAYFDTKGDVGGECFLINTDSLFERFIRKILFDLTNDNKFTSWKKGQEFGSVNSVEKTFKPDIIYDSKNNRAHAIIDVKNKFASDFKNADIYQVIFYSGLLEAKNLILCYPTVGSSEIGELEIYSNNFISNRVFAVHIDISCNDKTSFMKSITKFMDDIYYCIEKHIE